MNIEEAFDRDALIRTCEAEPSEIQVRYGMTLVSTPGRPGEDWYLFRDHGSRILAVAHLDTVQSDRTTKVVDTATGPVVHSGALDDRLGAYVLAELLPALGVQYDLLFTTGEESGCSTAQHFDPSDHHDREYDWIIEFDRGGTDVVLYQYEDQDLINRVKASGAYVEQGIFSDISYMEHLGVKAMNWGVGYRDYHSLRGHAYLADTFEMVGYYLEFAEQNDGIRLPHDGADTDEWWLGSRFEYDERDCIDYEPGQGWCWGDVEDTELGALCAEHREHYFGPEYLTSDLDPWTL